MPKRPSHRELLLDLERELAARDWPALHLEYVSRGDHSLLTWDYGPSEATWRPYLRSWRIDRYMVEWLLGVLRGECAARDAPEEADHA